MGKFNDLTGQRFGKLTALEVVGKDNYGQMKWLCACDCGNTKIICAGNLRNGHTVSCGCYNKQRVSKTHKKHGMFGTRIYATWSKMIQRCTNPNDKKYKNYGQRGISVCEEWRNSFQSFYEWSMNNGYKDNLTIDRINIDGNYEPKNCRWVGIDIQENNRTNNVFITIDGETKSMAQWCKINGINPNTANQRINNLNWNPIRAVTEKPKRRKNDS